MSGLYNLFKERATLAGAEVYRVAGYGEARGRLVTVLRELVARRVVAVRSPLVEALDLDEMARQSGVTVSFGDWRTTAVDADVGISELDFALAETGTLVQDATDVGKRLVSMLPPVHVALIRTRNILPSLRQMMGYLAKMDAVPGCVAFITGPSRTADIERVLTIGVHGPGRVIIVCIDGGEGSR
ncbi:MAG: Lactate utilization protein B/C [Clostridia bacterium 62_21]|nr:MAG: Lactate utilization protein B/C [Clostridia bacterium 62_21]